MANNDDTLTNLFNYALSMVGGVGTGENSFRIRTISDGTDLANMLLMLWPQARKEVLARADWPEALKYADLGAELSDVDKADWEYAFNLPADYLGRCRQVDEEYDSSTLPEDTYEYDKKIIAGKRLLTNEYSNADGDSAYIQYVYDLQDVSRYSTLLYKAMAINLAASISTWVLADKGARRVQLLEEFETLALPLAEGEAYDQQGSSDKDRGEYTALDCRITSD